MEISDDPSTTGVGVRLMDSGPSTGQVGTGRPLQEMEDRAVRVDDPHRSASANERLTEQVRQVVGNDHVFVTKDRPHPSRGDRTAADQRPSGGSSLNFILAVVALTFLVLGALLTTLTRSWWFVAFAVAGAVLAAATVLAMVLQMTGIREHADATTVAMLEEQGVHNPDELFFELVAEFTESHREDTSGTTGRATAVEDDPLKAGAEQAASGTPTGGRSKPVGPGTAT